MNLDELRRKEFPWTSSGTVSYLNHAGTGPLPIQRSTRVVARHSRSKSCCAHVGVADRSTNAMMASVRTSRECCTRRAGCRDAPAAEGK